jgi:glycogen debranching enzyme
MKVTHSYEKKSIGKDVEDASILLTNKLGGYAWINSEPRSRFDGLFFHLDNKMYKVNGKEVRALTNNFFNAERVKGGVREKFFMPDFFNSFVYKLDKKRDIGITLDIRESYASPDWNRTYEVFEENGKLIVKYTEEGGFEAYLVMGSELNYKVKGEWLERYYPFDHKRNSYPFNKFVYSALVVKTNRIVFSFSKDKKSAIEENNLVIKKLKSLEEQKRDSIRSIVHENDIFRKVQSKEIFFALLSAMSSLDGLLVSKYNEIGVFAGFPWFFQFWARDEAVCLKALFLRKNFKVAGRIMSRLLSSAGSEGNLPNQFPSSDLRSADAIGWLYKRVGEAAGQANIGVFLEKLESILELLQEWHTEGGFAVNGPLETWMDTGFDYDTRPGMRIEIQAFRLNMFKLLHQMSGSQKYLDMEISLKERVRENLWNGMVLADGFGDFTIRPNIFIACYAYPHILTQDEWYRCFDNAIPLLWLSWGGFATIQKSSPLFLNTYSGEDNSSYHRGDSWFWINNLAAIVLDRVDKVRYKSYIEGILGASTEEILWKGAIGHASELSSASVLESDGCICQAWSSALFIELIYAHFGL